MQIAKATLIKTIAIAGVGLLGVGGSGYILQQKGNRTAAQPQLAAAQPAPQPELRPVEAATAPAAEAPLALQQIELTSSPVSTPSTETGVAAQPAILPAQAEAPAGAPGDTAPATADCPLTLTAEAAAAAMVTLSLDAPCYKDERVAIHHEGMVFTELTDDAGKLTVSVPALAEFAIFVAVFQDGEGASADVEVSSLSFYDRSVLQWQGDEGLELHALEYGAGYDDAGHVWAGAPRDYTVAATGEGGFMTLLGNPDLPQARMAQVYSFPFGIARKPGTVDLSVEAQVTAANCGKDVSGQVITVSEGQFGVFHDLNVTMPGCDATGDYLLLKNLLDDLKIAAK